MKTKDHLKHITEWIRETNPNCNWPYACLEEFVLKNGREYSNHQKTKVERGKTGNCFENAYHLARRMRLTYAEAYVVCGIDPPMLHAWCVDDEGNVYDPTWEDGDDYFGVAFDMGYVTGTVLHRKVFGVIDNPEGGFPLLSGKDKNFKRKGGKDGRSKANGSKRIKTIILF